MKQSKPSKAQIKKNAIESFVSAISKAVDKGYRFLDIAEKSYYSPVKKQYILYTEILLEHPRSNKVIPVTFQYTNGISMPDVDIMVVGAKNSRTEGKLVIFGASDDGTFPNVFIPNKIKKARS